MARIAGVDLPREKRIEIGLTYIYGIGLTTSKKILAETGINPDTRVKDLDENDVSKLREYIDQKLRVEGELRSEVSLNIKRLMEIGCYRGIRHRKGLPVRGQSTKRNARTRKGPARAIAGNPDVLLFDEATSALDNAAQAQICENLDKMNITRIVIAHRLSTIKHCDRILVLDKGKIVEEGNYRELFEKRGLFYDMAVRQIAGIEEDKDL